MPPANSARGQPPGRSVASPPWADGIGRPGHNAQSTGSPPCSTSSALARENGFEPKNPRSADIGDGCAEAMIGCRPSSGRRVCASLPHSTATSGPPLADQRPDRRLGDRLPALAAVRCRACPVRRSAPGSAAARPGPTRRSGRRARAGRCRGRRAVPCRCCPATAAPAGRAGRRRTTARSGGRASGTGPGRRSAP